MDLPKYFSRAKQKHKDHAKFLNFLKRTKPKGLNKVMQETHDQVFSKVDCLDCANCCKTTGPLFTAVDIKRISSKLKMKEADFERTFLRKDEDNDYVLQTVPCTFLGEDNRCSIYEFRPKACREFPHTDRKKFYQINHLTIKNAKICPAVFEVLESARKHYAQ